MPVSCAGWSGVCPESDIGVCPEDTRTSADGGVVQLPGTTRGGAESLPHSLHGVMATVCDDPVKSSGTGEEALAQIAAGACDRHHMRPKTVHRQACRSSLGTFRRLRRPHSMSMCMLPCGHTVHRLGCGVAVDM